MSLQFTKIICHKINGLLYLALLAGAVLISAGCGGASRSQGNSSLPQPQSDLQLRVINGSVMEYGAVPQLLQLRGIDALGQEFICSAVSLGMGYVLTAGHCVVDVTELQVLRGESTYAVQEVELHPGYRVEPDVAAVFDDLAILVVPDLDIPGFPILLSRVPELGETLLALGVGLNSEGEFGVPQAGQVLLSGLTPNHAVSTFKEGFANPCVGDSGGPLLYQFVDGQGILQTGIVGIVSSGAFEDCRVGDTSLYTYLSPERTSFLMSVVPALGVL